MKYLTVYFLAFLLASSCGRDDNNTSIPNQAPTTPKEIYTEQKSNLRYYDNSLCLSILDTTTDSSTFNSFMRGLKETENYRSFDFIKIDRRGIATVDSVAYVTSDTGRIFNNRVINDDKKFNELSFLMKYFKALHYFEDYKNDFGSHPMVCIHHTIKLSSRQKQNFYLVFLSASFSNGDGSDQFLCSFNNFGKLIDSQILSFSEGQDRLYAKVSFDNKDNVHQTYCEEYPNDCKSDYDCYKEIIRIDNNGKFIQVSKKKYKKNENNCH